MNDDDDFKHAMACKHGGPGWPMCRACWSDGPELAVVDVPPSGKTIPIPPGFYDPRKPPVRS